MSIQLPSVGLIGVMGPRQHSDFGDGVDGSQSFTSKAHRANRFQVCKRGNFAGGMAFECHGQLIRSETDTIVFDGDAADTALDQAHANVCGTRIECVIDQLTNNGGRTFDHLAGSNLADQRIWELTDGAGGGHVFHNLHCSERGSEWLSSGRLGSERRAIICAWN